MVVIGVMLEQLDEDCQKDDPRKCLSRAYSKTPGADPSCSGHQSAQVSFWAQSTLFPLAMMRRRRLCTTKGLSLGFSSTSFHPSDIMSLF
jgi:hypothetical protein